SPRASPASPAIERNDGCFVDWSLATRVFSRDCPHAASAIFGYDIRFSYGFGAAARLSRGVRDRANLAGGAGVAPVPAGGQSEDPEAGAGLRTAAPHPLRARGQPDAGRRDALGLLPPDGRPDGGGRRGPLARGAPLRPAAPGGVH